LKKLLLLALLMAAVAVTVAPAASPAGDAPGPPCTNITNGDGKYGTVDPNTGSIIDYKFHFEYTLAAPVCDTATYTLYVYAFNTTTKQFELVGPLSPTQPVPPATTACTTLTGNCLAFDADYSTQQYGTICVVGVTTFRGRTVDVAPNGSTLQDPVCNATNTFVPGSSGGTSGFA
jgi:hypothetical protein